MTSKPDLPTTSTRLIDNSPLIVSLLLLVDSLHFVFARLLLPHLPPSASAFYVLGVATGVFIITFQPGDYLRIGSLLVLVSTFLHALHAALVKRYGGRLDFTAFFLFRLASTTGFLFVIAAVRGGLVWPGSRAWLLLALVGTVDVIVSRALYYLALRRLRMSLHSIVLTLSPVATILWSMLLFGSRPSLQELLGGLAGILILSAGQAQMAKVKPSRSTA
ncbi:MAG: EamA family transporter [Anaerolineae bacterium]